MSKKILAFDRLTARYFPSTRFELEQKLSILNGKIWKDGFITLKEYMKIVNPSWPEYPESENIVYDVETYIRFEGLSAFDLEIFPNLIVINNLLTRSYKP